MQSTTIQDTVEFALAKLVARKRGVYAIIQDQDQGLILIGPGYRNRIIQLWVEQDGNILTEKDYQERLVFQLKNEKMDPWYVRITKTNACAATSFSGHPLTLIALVEPVLINSVEDTTGRVPICVKLMFSKRGNAAAIIQNSDLCRLWALEGTTMLTNGTSVLQRDEFNMEDRLQYEGIRD